MLDPHIKMISATFGVGPNPRNKDTVLFRMGSEFGNQSFYYLTVEQAKTLITILTEITTEA